MCARHDLLEGPQAAPWAGAVTHTVQWRDRLRKGNPLLKVPWLMVGVGFCATLRLVLLMSLSLGSPVVPPSCATCTVGHSPSRLGSSGPRVTSSSLLHPSGVSKVTASGSRWSRLTARMEAGAPGPSSGHVHGHVGAGFDPAAGAVTIPRECSWLRWAGQGTPASPQARGAGRGRHVGQGGGRTLERRIPAGGLCSIGGDPKLWGGVRLDPFYLGLPSPIRRGIGESV